MINRALIRLKVVQLVYAYYQNEGKTIEVALKELDFSLEKSYDLYRSLLSLLVEIRRLAQHKADVRAANTRLANGGNDSYLANNKFLVQLEQNKLLSAWAEKQKTSWANEDKFLRRLYEAFLNDEAFTAYIDRNDDSYEADREVIRRLYKTHIMGNEDFEALLEEQSLYWNDDKEIVDSFVIKTIKRFDPANGEDQELLPAYADKEDQSFAAKLFTTTIERAEDIREMMRQNTRNWDFSRMALLDVIIIQIAAAEVIAFPSIPLNVTFSEYIDIAKYYSTPRSASYVHGMLDSIVKQLKEQGAILK
ncbi:MAG: transcription antitermination protein NusB [Bacteroidales bacterium]|nr:transcription antitermination protein NusB [Bacteroidales bacterium]